jgi:hypothetical protein
MVSNTIVRKHVRVRIPLPALGAALVTRGSGPYILV